MPDEQIKIKLTAEGSEQTRRELDEVARTVEDVGDQSAKSATLAGKLGDAALGMVAGFAGLNTIVGIFRDLADQMQKALERSQQFAGRAVSEEQLALQVAGMMGLPPTQEGQVQAAEAIRALQAAANLPTFEAAAQAQKGGLREMRLRGVAAERQQPALRRIGEVGAPRGLEAPALTAVAGILAQAGIVGTDEQIETAFSILNEVLGADLTPEALSAFGRVVSAVTAEGGSLVDAGSLFSAVMATGREPGRAAGVVESALRGEREAQKILARPEAQAAAELARRRAEAADPETVRRQTEQFAATRAARSDEARIQSERRRAAAGRGEFLYAQVREEVNRRLEEMQQAGELFTPDVAGLPMPGGRMEETFALTRAILREALVSAGIPEAEATRLGAVPMRHLFSPTDVALRAVVEQNVARLERAGYSRQQAENVIISVNAGSQYNFNSADTRRENFDPRGTLVGTN